MSRRAEDLMAMAAAQIDELDGLLAGSDTASLGRPCPGRDKLGDGTAGALATHVTDNYLRIAAFVAGEEDGHGHGHPGGRQQHGDHYAPDPTGSRGLRQRLSAARQRLARIALLGDAELDAVPAKGSFRLADGRRTLEQVLMGLLRHRGRQLGALAAALG